MKTLKEYGRLNQKSVDSLVKYMTDFNEEFGIDTNYDECLKEAQDIVFRSEIEQNVFDNSEQLTAYINKDRNVNIVYKLNEQIESAIISSKFNFFGQKVAKTILDNKKFSAKQIKVLANNVILD